MKVITAANDGTIVIEFTAEEARQIRDDLGQTAWDKVSPAGDRLHSHLEITHGPTRRRPTPATIHRSSPLPPRITRDEHIAKGEQLLADADAIPAHYDETNPVATLLIAQASAHFLAAQAIGNPA